MVLAVSGEIDIATVDDLGDAIDAVIDDGAVEVWVDLTPAEFMDSTGLRLLVAAGDRLRALNRSLAVICPPGAIRRTIELAGLHEVLPVFRDRTAAQRG
jgi:anti-sigma B factor antagonist